MRLAGTCRRYSKNAMPQLASAAMNHERSPRFFRCAYHANVIKTFDPISSTIVQTTAGIPHLVASGFRAGQEQAMMHHTFVFGEWNWLRPNALKFRDVYGRSARDLF